MSAAGIAADPFTVRPADILLTLYQSQPANPTVSGYSTITTSAGAFVGEQVCLRFAEANNLGPFIVGVDDVVFVTAKDPDGDTDGDTIPNSTDPDDDGDGCLDTAELQTALGSQNSGGRRNPHNYWDFFDTPDAANVRDAAVNAADIGRLVARFGSTGDRNVDPRSLPPASGYHTAFDRTLLGPNLWNVGAPDGSIAAQDIGLVVAQFGHSCVE